MNIKRSPAFFKIKANIRSCINEKQLQVCRDMISANSYKLSVDEIIVLTDYYYEKHNFFNSAFFEIKNEKVYQSRTNQAWNDIEEDSIESIYHRNKCGGHSTY